MPRALAVLIVFAFVPIGARADVVPRGWRPPPPAEETHVALFRASLAAWMSPEEQALLRARLHPRCVTVEARGRGAGYGSARRCPSVDLVREVAIDRGVRFFAAEILDAQGRPEDAAALRDGAPMRDATARAAASPRLTGDALEPARALVAHGMGWSLEQVAAALGRLVERAVLAGAARGRITEAAIEMLAELDRPLASVAAVVRVERGEDPAVRRAALRVGACLQPEVDARWRPVAVRVVIQRNAAGVAVTSRAPGSVLVCIERELRAALRPADTPRGDATSVVRVVHGPRGVVWGSPVELTGE